MQRLFLIVLFVAGAFVWMTSGGLPPMVASKFGPDGVAHALMSKGAYTALMLALVVGVPGLVAATTLLVRVLPPQLVNLPHKRYWLAPERRAATLAALASMSLRLAISLAVFMGFMHWLVVRAHAVQPPRLQESWFFAGLAVFGTVTLALILLLYRRFGRMP